MKKIVAGTLTAITAKEKKKLVLFIFLNAAVNITDISALAGLLYVVKLYTQPQGGLTSNWLPTLLRQNTTLWPVVMVVILFIIKNIAGYWVYRTQCGFINNVADRIAQQNLTGYLYGPYGTYSSTDSAVYISKIIYQPAEFAQFVLQGLQQAATESIMVLLSATALLLYKTSLFIVVCLTLLPAVLALTWLTKKKLAAIKNNIRFGAAQSHQYLNEALKGYVESNIFNKNDFFINRHSASQSRLGSYITQLKITQDLPARFFEVFAVAGLFILIISARFISTGNDGVILIGAFTAAAYKIIPGISKIITQAGFIKSYAHTITTAGKPCNVSANKNAAANAIKHVTCENIYFGYNGVTILRGFSCALHAGMFAGISGVSGCGKTTLLQLIAAFYTPCKGHVLINGRAINDATKKSYWKNIAYVKQEPFIAHESILNNIIMFGKEYDGQRLHTVLEVTGVNEIAALYPKGIHTQIMEAGRNISGGQRQRIATARALYKNADLILLDEPFSELDEASELKILRYLKHLATEGKIVVLISHSTQSFRYCDTVMRL
ncbi:MAG TPA: ABC transporter ATP-binding protein [Chitinophagaceae bacterium]|nr:ABC transporter ATP-binding protein [Chitinophagaceae bacterium]